MKPLETIYWLRLALGITAALLCIGYGLVSGTMPKNLVLNPSVEGEGTEVTPPEWLSSQTGTEWSTAYVRTGSRSIRVNVVNGTAEWRGKVKPVHQDHTYRVHGFFRGEVNSSQFFLTVRWFSDLEGVSAIVENNVSIPVNSYPEWTKLGDLFTAPKKAKSCDIVFRAINGSGDLYGDDFKVGQPRSLTTFVNGLSIALITYLVSYYIIKSRFSQNVNTTRKLMTTGIGIYIISWMVLWTLLYTIMAGATA
jgi:hypothetical protein